MAVASTGYTLIARETTPGTPRNREEYNYFFYPAEEVEIMPGKEFIDFREIRGSRQAMITLDGPFRPTANMKGALYPTGATALFFAGAMGSVSTEDLGNNVYRHEFVDAPTLPSFTLERSNVHNGTTFIEQVAGAKVESVQVACAFGEKANLTVNFQAAKKPTKLATTFFDDANITAGKFPNTMLPFTDLSSGNYFVNPLIFRDAAIWLANQDDSFGSENRLMTMKNINLELRNTLTRQETLNGDDDTYKLFEGGFECTLSGSMVFESASMYQRVLNGTPVKIKLSFANNDIISGDTAHGMRFEWPSVKVSRASLPFRAGEVIESDVEFKVRFNPSNNRAVFIYMTDSREGYGFS